MWKSHQLHLYPYLCSYSVSVSVLFGTEMPGLASEGGTTSGESEFKGVGDPIVISYIYFCTEKIC